MVHISVICRRLLPIACLVVIAKADGWDDFSNNLATDLAPFLALFGEQVTKQFLSESTTLLDNIIFAMAPLGIITAVVSAIRVCGGASLRAFIGRAQEGGGIAEAELCSSTSRDVCELYHNGAIVRVFGRPKILEIVHDRDADLPDDSSKTPPECGIYSFQDYIKKGLAEKAGWEEQPTKDAQYPVQTRQKKQAKNEDEGDGHPLRGDIEAQQKPSQNAKGNDDRFAPNPNLSFNIGIREQPSYVLRLAAIAGFLIQAAVLVFGFLATYTWRWTKNNALPPSWAFPLMSLGTLLLSGGMFFCAFLIENSTKERVFRRDSTEDRDGPTIYVVQPGNQIVGDQTFDAFSFTDASHRLSKYTTSWKLQEKAELKVCFATGTTLAGFVLQFVGFRAMHSSVSVFQLGAIILMSIIRAGLRTQRLAKEQNLLRDRPDEVQGHELDWLALQMAKDKPEEPAEGRIFWSVIGGPLKLQPSQGTKRQLAQRAFFYRSRLAELTSQPTLTKSKSSTAWDERLVHVRQQARQLKQAIESTASVLFSQGIVKSDWKDAESIPWAIKVAEYDQLMPKEASIVHLRLYKGKGSGRSIVWEVNQHYLEAVTGLWTWSIISNPLAEKTDEFKLRVSEASEVPASRIMAIGATEEEIEGARGELGLWIEDLPPFTSCEKWTSEVEPIHSGTSRWMAQMGVSTSVCHLIPSEPTQNRLRLYGWQTISDDSPLEMFALTSPVNHSISATCAHDIYQSFLCAVIGMLDSVGGETRALIGSRGCLFKNEVIARLAECFRESGLGSTQDAYLVIIPALRTRSKLPFSKDTLRSIHIDAENSRNEGRLEDAELLLKWAWKTISDIPDNELMAETMLELGELYRYALFGKNEASKQFGCKGISWMKKVTQNQSPNHEVAIIADRYANLEAESRADIQSEATTQRIMDAISREDRTKALRLISHANEVSTTDGNRRTILSWAAQQGWPEIVKTALKLGSPIDDRDILERTPLSYAAEHGHAHVVEILMERGALPFTQDSILRTPLSYAAGRGCHSAMKILLDDRRVSVFAKDQDGESPLHWAARYGQDRAIELLLQHGAKAILDNPNRQGHSALVVTLLNRHKTTAEFLVTNGAQFDISIDKIDGWKWAVTQGEWTCAAFLLRHLNERSKQRKVVIVTMWPIDARKWQLDVSNWNSHDTGIRPFQDEDGLASQDALSEIMVYMLASNGTETVFTMETVVGALEWGWDVIMEVCELGDRVPKYDLLKTNLLPNQTGAMADLLLDQLGKEVKITDNVVQAAARNVDSGESIIKLLLDQRGDEVKVTEKVLQAAAENVRSGKSIIKLLLDRRGDEVKVTEKVLQAAAENLGSGEEIIKLLLDRRGQEVEITEKFVQAAARNWLSGEEIIKLLLDQRGEEVKVTEKIIQAAAENSRSGKEIIKLLLDQRGGEIKITDSIVKAAAKEEIKILLLDHRKKEV